jgi:hypothetical protein
MTGTFETPTNKTIVFLGNIITFTTAEVLEIGQEVYISGNKAVAKRTTGAQFPIGIVETPSTEANQVVAIKTGFSRVIQGVAIGGTIAAGALVRPNGVLSTDDLPQYVATTTGNLATAIVLKGGSANAVIEIGILDSPVTVA